MRIRILDDNVKKIAENICAAAVSGENSNADIVTACGVAFVSMCYAFKDESVDHDQLRNVMIRVIDDIASSLRAVMEGQNK